MTNLFVLINGLPRDADETQRKEILFMFIGDIISQEDVKAGEVKITLITDKATGNYRNFLFLEVNDDEKANKLIDTLNETSKNDYGIIINKAEERKPKTFGTGGNKPYSNGGGYSSGSNGGGYGKKPSFGGSSRGGAAGGSKSGFKSKWN